MAQLNNPDMWTRAARIESFRHPQKKTKKRSSAHSKKTVTGRWPHETPTVEQLAHAGFYFHFSNDEDIDSTKCFFCGLKLDGWEPEDDPAREHISHIKQNERCAWATSLSVWRDEGEELESRDPLSEELFGARKDTFSDRWPHEGKRGWKCTVDRMAEAGWSFDPSLEDVDGVTCHFCALSLSEFEPKDDPYEEHKRRRPECRFFELIDFHHDGKLPKRKKAKTTKSRSSVASKASRASVQSAFSIAATEDLDVGEHGQGSEAEIEQPKPKANRATKSKTSKVSKARSDVQSQDENVSEAEGEVVAVKPKKQTKKASQPRKLASKKVSIVEQRISDASVQLQAELDESALEGSPNYWVNPDRSSMESFRGTKRTSDGEIKKEQLDDADLAFPLPPTAVIPQQEPKPKRAKTVRTSKTKAAPVAIHEDDDASIASELARLEAEETAKSIQQLRRPQLPGPQNKAIQVLQDEIDADDTTPIAVEPQAPALTPSPSTSDKENSLFSIVSAKAGPNAVYVSPTKSSRAPLAQSTPNRLLKKASTFTSPSKRHLGMLTSTAPWSAIDIEALLLSSPDKGTTPGGKLRNQLTDAAGVLSQAERAMTVEAWIKWRSGLSEHELRRRCEEHVGAFEREGNRALECLHGLNVTA